MFFAARRRLAAVSVKGFQLSFNDGSVAGAAGIARLTRYPMIARTIVATATTVGPLGFNATNTPPAIVPTRIATNVPDSTNALPPTSSSLARDCGMMAYFTGPKSVECKPIRNSEMKSTPRFAVTNPNAASAITTISKIFTPRITRVFSYLSASCPANAENKTNGKMNTAPAAFTSKFESIPTSVIPPNAMKIIMPFLNTLSFIAPKNCVQKNGAKRRSPSNANWLCSDMTILFGGVNFCCVGVAK